MTTGCRGKAMVRRRSTVRVRQSASVNLSARRARRSRRASCSSWPEFIAAGRHGAGVDACVEHAGSPHTLGRPCRREWREGVPTGTASFLRMAAAFAPAGGSTVPTDQADLPHTGQDDLYGSVCRVPGHPTLSAPSALQHDVSAAVSGYRSLCGHRIKSLTASGPESRLIPGLIGSGGRI